MQTKEANIGPEFKQEMLTGGHVTDWNKCSALPGQLKYNTTCGVAQHVRGVVLSGTQCTEYGQARNIPPL